MSLTSASFGGRSVGTSGADSAVAFLTRRYAQLGLGGAFASSYEQRFVIGPLAGAYARLPDTTSARNVVAVIPGSDPALRSEYVVVGAHYDHIGLGGFGAGDAQNGPALHPGADDNASGTAAVLELARRLAANPPPRSVVLAHFGTEEVGLVGSQVFVGASPVPLGSVVLMLNLDMVGRLRGDELLVGGLGSGTGLRALVDSAVAPSRLAVIEDESGEGRTDHSSFEARGVAALTFFTGFHPDYHRATDSAERVNVAGLGRIVDVAERVVRAASRATVLSPGSSSRLRHDRTLAAASSEGGSDGRAAPAAPAVERRSRHRSIAP